MNDLRQTPYRQKGSMLLEALISILIFSIGILAIIGLQASSIKLSSDAKYRSDASLLANQQLALMWNDIASAVTASTGTGPTPFNSAEFVSFIGDTNTPAFSGGSNFDSWAANVKLMLPNATAKIVPTSAVVATNPNTVLLCDNNPCTGLAGVLQTTRTDVTITITWQAPGETPHNYSTTALISAQKQL